ncbi:hypothetical protein K6L05_03650 [Salinicoccus roseus]|uniref:hypothetical protein n=1 Tax=Salinicoccus roseus TaxID=45670 RepID=UPI001CA768EB|nr:hypothetical protein [Salinicoccus roseus]MBY8908879.1 hypothetical protein [Salinicoccus roseus]
MTRKRYKTIDTDTGEVVTGRFYSTEQIEAHERQKHRQAVKQSSSEPFTFVEMEGVSRDMGKMTNKDLGYLLILQSYMDWQNMIKNKPMDKLPMTKQEMQAVLQIRSEKTLRGLLKRFTERELINEGSAESYGKSYKAYYINSAYCFRKSVIGDNKNRKTDKAVKVFMDSIKDVYKETAIKPADIGFLMRVIPYINYHSNILCKDPSKRDHSEAQYMTIAEIAKEVRMSREETAKKIASLTWGDKYVFARIKVGTGSNQIIKVNPYVMSRSSGIEALGYEFFVHPETALEQGAL